MLHLFTCHGRIMPRLVELLLPISKKERLTEILQAVMPHFMVILITYINSLNLSWIKNVYL